MEKKWEDCGRDDLNMIPKMQAAGWSPNFTRADERGERVTPENAPFDCVSFIKGRTHAWKAYRRNPRGVGYWIAADLREGSYYNHREYESLDEVIQKEGGRP